MLDNSHDAGTDDVENSDAAIQQYLAIRKEKKSKDKSGKKPKLPNSARGALNPDKMQYAADEREIQQYYRTGIIEEVKEKKGTDKLSRSEELLTDVLGYAAVRMYRKAKLESMYGRFLDRTSSQDPIGQIISTLKALNLAAANSSATNKKDEKGGIKAVLGKLLSEESQTITSGDVPSFDDWKKQQLSEGTQIIEKRSMKEFAVIQDDFSNDDDDDINLDVENL